MSRELSIFTGNAHPELAREVCRHLGVGLGRAEVFEFSNENIFVKINQNVREHDVFVVQPFCSPVNRSVMELLIMLDALTRASASRITAVVPYFAYARSDKKDQPRVPITARLLAEMIQVAGASRLLTMDLHAGQVQGFFRIPVDELTAMHLVVDAIRELHLPDPVVVAPDLGFAKKARNFASMIDASLAFVEKRRTSNDSTVESLGVIGDVRGKTAIIVDDEIDTASSLMGAVHLLVQEGAREVYAASTHAILSGPAVERIRQLPIRKLLCTDTVRLDEKKRLLENLHVVSVAGLLAEAIQRIHTGESVGALFGAAV